jgi:hypothetical protein
MGYPLDHGPGYAVVPRTAARFERLMSDQPALAVYFYCVCHATHRAGERRTSKGGTVHLEVGQCFLGQRRLADLLSVDRKTVKRALGTLSRLGLVKSTTDRNGTIATVVNYGAFGGHLGQSVGQPMGQPVGQSLVQSVDQPLDQSLDTKEREEREEREKPLSASADAAQLSLVGASPSGPIGPSQPKSESTRTPPGESKRTTPPKASKPPGDHQALIAHFDQRFRSAHGGAKPTWGAAQGKQAKRLLAAHTLEECKRRVDTLFDSAPAWMDGRDFGTLVKHFDKLATRAPARRSSGREQLGAGRRERLGGGR